MEPRPLQQVDRTYVRYGNRKLNYFAGCDYFRLGSHPKVLAALQEGVRKFGLNVAASRMTTGNHEIFGKLEKAIAQFFRAESATLVSSGYVTNLVVAQALANEFSHVLLDEKAHPSLRDAAKFFQRPIHIFQHRDTRHLAKVVKKIGKKARPILLTDGMFSGDGSLAPLASYLEILPRHGWLLVDDAHGAGTLGKSGKGTLQLEQVNRQRVIQTITLSKSFGVYGGAILGSRGLRGKILAKSGMFTGSTPLPLPLANASLIAVQVLQKENSLRRKLVKNVTYVKSTLSEAGFALEQSPSPIISIVPKTALEAAGLKTRCLKNGVFPSFIRYPGAPKEGYFRFVISSEHTKKQLDSLLSAIIGNKLS